jgi:hypothetical protein
VRHEVPRSHRPYTHCPLGVDCEALDGDSGLMEGRGEGKGRRGREKEEEEGTSRIRM